MFRAVLDFFLGSLLQRWRYGDGLLFGAPLLLLLSESLFSEKITGFWSRIPFLLIALGQAYLFNDLFDAERDLKNPKKDARYVQFLLRYRQPLFFAHAGAVLLLVGIGFFFGVREGIFFILFYALGVLYSFLFKRIPVLDLLWVGLWGGSYLGMVTGAPRSLAIIALMTAISHLFQTEVDLPVDHGFQIRTSAVLHRFTKELLLGGLCFPLFLLLKPYLPFPFPLFAFVPLLFYAWFPPLKGWILSKGVLGLLWIGMIAGDLYGIY